MVVSGSLGAPRGRGERRPTLAPIATRMASLRSMLLASLEGDPRRARATKPAKEIPIGTARQES